MKILCMLGQHDFQLAHSHPDSKLGFCIYECARCQKAVVSDPGARGHFSTLNTQAAIDRDSVQCSDGYQRTEKTKAINAEYEPYAEIIQNALAGRSASKADLDRHPEHNAPRYIVRMCEALEQAIHDAGNHSVTLADIVRLESTCTGADYHHKLALRSYRLAHIQNS